MRKKNSNPEQIAPLALKRVERSLRMNDDAQDRLSETLIEARNSRSWSISDLASVSGVSGSGICEIENKKRGGAGPNLRVICNLASALGLTLSELFEGLGERRLPRKLQRSEKEAEQ